MAAQAAAAEAQRASEEEDRMIALSVENQAIISQLRGTVLRLSAPNASDRTNPKVIRSAIAPPRRRCTRTNRILDLIMAMPVSYTHLTLPTICSV